MLTIFEEIVRMKKTGMAGVLVTVIEKKGHGPAIVGKKLLIDQHGRSRGTIGGGELERLAMVKAREFIAEKTHSVQTYNLPDDIVADAGLDTNMACRDRVTLYFEYIPTMPHVFIFGAGHVGRCLVDYLQKLNYRITVIDDRAQLVDDLQGACRILTGDYSEIIQREMVPPESFFVIAGYNHDVDYQILRAMYQSGQLPKYIGLLASRRKAALIMSKVREEFGETANLGLVHAPVGLDIGGQSPEEIALSIAAEIQAINYGKKADMHLASD